MKSLTTTQKSKMTIEEIQAFYKIDDYLKLAELIKEKINSQEITPIKASKTNGKKPALFNSYWIKKEEPKGIWIEELDYKIHPKLNIDYYKNNPSNYQKDRENILKLSNYLHHTRLDKNPPCSVNERSFEVFSMEKYLENGGRQLLKNLSFPIEALNMYETSEPIAYYSHHKQVPQNILIIENKDTFYSFRKHLLKGNTTILGESVGTIIYGRGKGIIKSFKDFSLCAEPYMMDSKVTFLYFGDLDYEGVRIYESFYEKFRDLYNIKLFIRGYEEMLKKSENVTLPHTKDGQSYSECLKFLKEFSTAEQEKMRNLLEGRKYIPQEIIMISDL